jgi:hypothetical protein
MDTDGHEFEGGAERVGTICTHPLLNRVSSLLACWKGKHRRAVQEGSRGLRSAERDDTPGTETKTERTPEGCKKLTPLRTNDSGTPSGCCSNGAANRGAALRCDPRLPSGNPPGCSAVASDTRSQRGVANCHPPLVGASLTVLISFAIATMSCLLEQHQGATG